MEHIREDQVKVTVIIPVYNTEKYLRKCLDSVTTQTLKEIEILCVDDGSTDHCPEILKEYAAKDRRVRVICKENGGLVSARKKGVREAKGRYIGYVDSDDWIEPDMYELLYRQAVMHQVDMVSSGYYHEGNYTTVHFDTLPEGRYGQDRIQYLRDNMIYKLDSQESGLKASLCYKLFLAEQLRKIQPEVPDSITIAEDKMCLLMFVLDCSSVYVLNKAFYHYRIHGASMMHMPNPGHLLCVNEVYKCLLKLYTHRNFTSAMRIQGEIYITELLLAGINKKLGFQMKDLFWVDPGWLDGIPENSRVALYGAGELGEKYRRQMSGRRDLKLTAYVDFGYERFQGGSVEVQPPDVLRNQDFDNVVITIKNPEKAKEIKYRLIQLGIGEDKILWFRQKEIFWKYVLAEGLLTEALGE